MKKVLWLASWYPNESDLNTGDFIKRMAEAVSLFLPITVVFSGKAKKRGGQQDASELFREQSFENMEEHILYFSGIMSAPTQLSRLMHLYRYFKKHSELFKSLKASGQMPKLVHVHVAMKSGLIALFLKWKYKIPYVVTEHWSGYYEQSAESLFKKSYIEKYLTKKILKNALLLLPVSEHLGKQITKCWVQIPFKKIYNVVDTRFFYFPQNTEIPKFRFVHVSSLLFPKNVEGIVRAFKHFIELGFDAELVLVGRHNQALSEYIFRENLPVNRLFCPGELSYKEVAGELQRASALIMFSFYENMPCAILEALCTGLPVITTPVGGIPEIISEENGIFVSPGDISELIGAMKKMIGSYAAYDRTAISRKAADMFSYQKIGNQIVDIYNQLLD